MSALSLLTKLHFCNWLTRVFGHKSNPIQYKRRARFRSLAFEALESRLAPATVTQAGTVLAITLDTVNEQIAFTSNGATYAVTTSNPSFAGGPLANFVSAGNAGTITAAG